VAANSAADVLNRLGDRWKGIVRRAADLEALREEGRRGTDLSRPAGQEHEEAERLKMKLLKEYRGRKIEDVFDGREVAVDRATSYRIQSKSPLAVAMADPDSVRERLLSQLQLLYGIGRVREERLKSLGFTTIADLAGHPRYGGEALNGPDIVVSQYLVRGTGEEVGALKMFLSHLRPASFLVTFNDQETGNVGPLISIVTHNRQDLVTLAQLFARLHRKWQ